MLMTSQSKVTVKTTISMTWELCSTSCGLTNWRWTWLNHYWECRVANFLDLSSHLKEFTLNLTKLRQFRACNPENSQRAQKSIRQICLYSKIHCKSFRPLPTVYTINEERRLLRIGWSLPRCFREYQRIFHQASGPTGSHFEKTIPPLCTRYGSFFGRTSSTEEWRRLRTGHLLFTQNFDRGWISIQPHQKECLALIFTVRRHDIIWLAKPYMLF